MLSGCNHSNKQCHGHHRCCWDTHSEPISTAVPLGTPGDTRQPLTVQEGSRDLIEFQTELHALELHKSAQLRVVDYTQKDAVPTDS